MCETQWIKTLETVCPYASYKFNASKRLVHFSTYPISMRSFPWTSSDFATFIDCLWHLRNLTNLELDYTLINRDEDLSLLTNYVEKNRTLLHLILFTRREHNIFMRIIVPTCLDDDSSLARSMSTYRERRLIRAVARNQTLRSFSISNFVPIDPALASDIAVLLRENYALRKLKFAKPYYRMSNESSGTIRSALRGNVTLTRHNFKMHTSIWRKPWRHWLPIKLLLTK
jgi:hypothetical protein